MLEQCILRRSTVDSTSLQADNSASSQLALAITIKKTIGQTVQELIFNQINRHTTKVVKLITLLRSREGSMAFLY